MLYSSYKNNIIGANRIPILPEQSDTMKDLSATWVRLEKGITEATTLLDRLVAYSDQLVPKPPHPPLVPRQYFYSYTNDFFSDDHTVGIVAHARKTAEIVEENITVAQSISKPATKYGILSRLWASPYTFTEKENHAINGTPQPEQCQLMLTQATELSERAVAIQDKLTNTKTLAQNPEVIQIALNTLTQVPPKLHNQVIYLQQVLNHLQQFHRTIRLVNSRSQRPVDTQSFQAPEERPTANPDKDKAPTTASLSPLTAAGQSTASAEAADAASPAVPTPLPLPATGSAEAPTLLREADENIWGAPTQSPISALTAREVTPLLPPDSAFIASEEEVPMGLPVDQSPMGLPIPNQADESVLSQLRCVIS